MLDLIAELWAFVRERRKYWMFPVLLILLILSGLLILSQTSALAPLIYTLF